MLWIILCVITAIIYSISGFMDNYITDVAFARRKPQSMKIFNGISYLLFAIAILICVRDIAFPNLGISLIIMASGAVTALSSIPYYIGLKAEEATSASILEQMGPILFLLTSVFIFHEQIDSIQILALIFLMSAPLAIIFSQKHHKHRKKKIRTTAFFALYVLLLTASSIIYAHYGEGQDYFGCFVLFLIGRGSFDLIASAFRKDWQKDFKFIWKRRRAVFLKTAIINQILCIIAEFTSRRALIDGNTAIASALMNSLELIFTFILGISLTLIWPNFGREKLKRRTVAAHLIGTICCTIGIIIINLTGFEY